MKKPVKPYKDYEDDETALVPGHDRHYKLNDYQMRRNHYIKHKRNGQR